METHALIPFVAMLVSAAFGAVAIAWDSDRRATRSMALLFACTGTWALVDLLTYVETDPERALMWMRWCHVAPLMIGPCLLALVGDILPEAPARLHAQARGAAVVLLVIGLATVILPGSVSGLVATDYGGWMPIYGPVSVVVIPLGTVLPIYAGVVASRVKAASSGDPGDPVDQRRAWALRLAIAFSILATFPTEFALPLLGVPVPRLGAFVVSLSAVLAWLHVLHESDDLSVTPQGVARGVLGHLRDGVALVRLDGTVLSTNSRFCELAGRKTADVIGASLSDLTDAPLLRICTGVQDRKANLYGEDGEPLPVSLSSSVARSRTGHELGVVVVFRDLREVDVLRAQLLNSGRLAAIGELAAGIAHEVNNPLAFIRSDLNILSERMSEIQSHLVGRSEFDHEVLLFDRGARRVASALEGIERVTQVVSDVREFAHVGGAGQGGCDPESVVEGAMRLARLQRESEIDLRIASVACSDRFDSGQELKQILLALFQILIETAEKGGGIEADLRTDESDFTIGLSAGPLVVSAEEMLERFEVLSHSSREAAHADVSLGVAAELISRLKGRVSVEAARDHHVRLELSVPLHTSHASESR